MVDCFKLINNIDVSNNKYIFNNSITNVSYGLYSTSGDIFYTIKNIPKKYPLGFYSNQSQDISNIIEISPVYSNPITIYVSRGNDISFNNGDYFRFYDDSFNIINLTTNISNLDLHITNSGDNFYFMKNMQYKFQATTDFSTSSPFAISISNGDSYFSDLNQNNKLLESDSSFIITIPYNINNNDKFIYYYDLCSINQNISGNLEILVDQSNINYYYGDISFTIDQSFASYPNRYISIKSYPNDVESEISNIDLFIYSSTCQYIIAETNKDNYFLYNNNSPSGECLNIVSKAYYNLNNNFYEFNKDTHGRNVKDKLNSYLDNNNNNILETLNYGIYDGSYTIFDICKNYPICLNNIELSNNIYIDENYIKTNYIVFQNTKFYYDAIRIIIDNSNSILQDNSTVDIKLLRLDENNNRSIIDLSNKFFYNSICQSSDTVNSLTDNSSEFILINKDGTIFTHHLRHQVENFYKLNKFETYLKIPNPNFSVKDRYGHNLNHLVTSSCPLDLSDVIRVTNNYNDLSFIINYSLIDYEDNYLFSQRIVEIQEGPFIEIDENYYYLFKNNNPNSIIELSSNLFFDSISILQAINVYYYRDENTKIYLPYEITLSGYYYDILSTYSNLITNNTLNLSNPNIIKYENIVIQQDKQAIYFPNNDNNRVYYYLTPNIQFNYIVNVLDRVTTDGIMIKDISFYNYNDLDSEISDIINNTSLIQIANNNIILNGDTINPNNILNLDNSFLVFSHNYTKINQNLQNDTVYNSISKIIILEDRKFLIDISIDIIDLTNNTLNFTISGEFNYPILFDQNKIDLSFIGKYELDINVKGLNINDNIYKDVSDLNLISNFSKKIVIDVINVDPPTIQFSNSIQPIDASNYLYKHKVGVSFDILGYDIPDITFTRYNILQTDLKPIIEFSSSTIYDGDLCYNILESGTSIITNDILFSNSAETIEIQYFAYDLCGNQSNIITLSLELLDNIMSLEFSGNTIKYISFLDTFFIDDGIKINDEYISDFDFSFQKSDVNFNKSIQRILSSVNYDINYSTDIYFNKIGLYDLSYIVSIPNDVSNVITRKLIIYKDAPYFKFPNLSSINYINNLSDSIYINAYQRNTILNSYNVNSNRNLIDFSLNVQATFLDISTILNNFDISDNYQGMLLSDLSYSIKIKLLENSDLSYLEFTENNFFLLNNLNKINNNLSLSVKKYTIKYQVSDICQSNLTIYNDILSQITNIDDSYNNWFNFSLDRNMNIVDISNPNLLFNPIDQPYISYGANYIDFSYEAFNYDINPIQFINEISNILYNFTLSDIYDIDASLNYTISISNSSDSVLIHDISSQIQSSTHSIFLRNLFKSINNSFQIVYDISDNYNNIDRYIRNVKIITTTNNQFIDISLTSLGNELLDENYTINISFGDLLIDISSYFRLIHKRLDISIDISYEFSFNCVGSANITSLTGLNGILFDPSALIYNEGTEPVNVFYINNNYNLITDPTNFNININNFGPVFTIDPTTIIHKAGIPIPDISLIYGVIAISEYDKFYYYNYETDISYTSTIFQTSIDASLSINGSQDNPSPGVYTIKYKATDKNNKDNIGIRTLIVEDRSGPIINYIDQSYVEIFRDSTYTDIIDVVDAYSNLYEIKISKNSIINDQYIDICNISNINQLTYNLSLDLLTLIDTNILTTYNIKYIASDVSLNSVEKIKIIKIIEKPIIIYPQIDICNIIFNLDSTFDNCFNTIFNNGIDISLNNLSYDVNRKTILYEANAKVTFYNFIDFSLVSNINNYIYNIIKPGETDTYTPGIYEIIYNIFDSTFRSKTEIIYLRISDQTKPIISFIESSEHENIEEITLPEISLNIFNDISKNFLKLDLSYGFLNSDINRRNSIFINDGSNTIYSIPGIKINDNTHIDTSFTLSLSNETLTTNNFILEISYINLSDNSYVDNYKLLETSGNYKQIYTVKDLFNNTAREERTIIVKRFEPFIILSPIKDICDNEYYSIYSPIYNLYRETIKGYPMDYYDGSLNQSNIIVNYDRLNINNIGKQFIELSIHNNDLIGTISRTINIVNIVCLQLNEENFTYDYITENKLNNDLSYTKLGVYNTDNNVYKIKIDNSQNAIRIFGYNFENNNVYNSNNEYDISNIISITGTTRLFPTISGKTYYYGNISLNINGDFNRASVEFLENGQPKILKDLFLYSDTCLIRDISYNILDNLPYVNRFIVDISRDNINTTSQYFTISGEDNNIIGNNIDLHLPIGWYKFIQSNYRNFFNQIKFSLYPNGINPDDPSQIIQEYKKNVENNNLAGFHNSYTAILLDATTPTLYYYSKNFSISGGKITIKNNIILHKNNIVLNGNVNKKDNSNRQYIYGFTQDMLDENIENTKNKIYLSARTRNNSTNFIGITQLNIFHNILIDNSSNKIIFKNYDLSNNLKGDNNYNNYLLDTSINNTKANILYYNFQKDTSVNFLESANQNNYYETNLLDIFFNINEFNNYRYFFKKNQIENFPYLGNYFTNKLNDIRYINKVNIFNGDGYYDFIINNQNLINNNIKIKLNEIISNLIYINFQTYIDLSIIPINNNKLTYLKNNVFDNQNITTNYPIDLINLFFSEFFMIILSDISAQASTTRDDIAQSIVFSNGIIELNEYLLDNSNRDISLDQSLDISNTIFLSLDVQDTNNNSKIPYIGLTQKNIFHNMFVENEKFIFHKYDISTNNYQVNISGLTLDDTLNDDINDNLYLLDICENDIYNCYVIDQSNNNIYDNCINKIVISYFIEDELALESDEIINNRIIPFSVNNIYREINYNNNNEYELIYNEISYNSLSSLYGNQLDFHSNSYLIKLNDYFDIQKYKDKIDLPNELINKKYLNYYIKNINFDNRFDLYDNSNNQYIISDNNDIDKLNALQSEILILNYKLDFVFYHIGNNLNNSDIIIDYNNNDYVLYNTNNQSLNFLLDRIDYRQNQEIPEIVSKSLNKLYLENYTNTISIINKYNKLNTNYNLFISDTIADNLIPISTINYIDNRNYDNVNRMITDISRLESNITNLYNDYQLRPASSSENLVQGNNLDNSYVLYDKSQQILLIYNNFVKKYTFITTVLKQRHADNRGLLDTYGTITYIENNLFSYEISRSHKLFVVNLINNFISLDYIIFYDLSYSNYRTIPYSDISNNIDISLTNINYLDASLIDILDNSLNIIIEDICYNLNILYTIIEENFIEYTPINYTSINYLLSLDNMVIVSQKSNVITMNVEIYYNNYIYPYKLLDTLTIDLSIPDLLSPIVELNDNDDNINIDFTYDIFSESSRFFNELIEKFKFIDINQENLDISNNIFIKVLRLDGQSVIRDISYNYSLNNPLITIDICYNDIIYTFKDNANNSNIIYANILNKLPIVYYQNIVVNNNFNNIPLVIYQNEIDINIIIQKAIENVIVKTYDNTEILIYKFSPSYQNIGYHIDISSINNVPLTLTYHIYDTFSDLKVIRDISLIEVDIEIIEISTHCCFPPVYYKEIQNNYKMGSLNSVSRRMSNILNYKKYY